MYHSSFCIKIKYLDLIWYERFPSRASRNQCIAIPFNVPIFQNAHLCSHSSEYEILALYRYVRNALVWRGINISYLKSMEVEGQNEVIELQEEQYEWLPLLSPFILAPLEIEVQHFGGACIGSMYLINIYGRHNISSRATVFSFPLPPL